MTESWIAESLIPDSFLAALASLATTSHILDSTLGRSLIYLATALLTGIRLWLSYFHLVTPLPYLPWIALASGVLGCLLLMYSTLAQLAPSTDTMMLPILSWEDIGTFLFHTSVGIGWLAFLMALLTAVIWIERRASWVAVLVMLVALSANSHAGEYGFFSAMFWIDLLHLALAMLWSGGVLILLYLQLGIANTSDGSCAGRFSKLALPLFLLLLASGIFRLMMQYETDRSLSELYVGVLLLKLAAIGGVILAAHGLRKQLKSGSLSDNDFDNGLSIEVFFMAILVFLTAMITQLPTL
jgi:putative copper resistance protein D